MIIRPLKEGEAPALFKVYWSAVHLVAKNDYTDQQLNAWAPRDLDPKLWVKRIRAISPWVVELRGELVGYADLQPNGYIDHFYVSGHHPRQGIGRALMQATLARAYAMKIVELTSDVSRTAQGFFERFGLQSLNTMPPWSAAS